MGVRTTVYLQVEPEWSYSGEQVRGAKVVRLTQRAPGGNQIGGTVLVKITLDVAENAFKPLRPEAVVVIPEGLGVAKPIEVFAEEPDPE